MLTAARLRRLLYYDPATGVFTWRNPTSARVKAGRVAGSLHKSGYLQIGIDKKLYFAQRLAWLYVKGRWPTHEVDHRNRLRADNRFSNLRHASRKQNSENITRRSDNTSGYTGVYWLERISKWYAQIRHHGVQIHLGYFSRVKDAVRARHQAELHLFTHSERT